VALFDKIISNRREIWGNGLQIDNARALFAIRQECVRHHYLRCGGRVGIQWPIYRATLLMSAILILSTPIIFGVGCIRTTDTKDTYLRSRLH
jgi:hypothetical protein